MKAVSFVRTSKDVSPEKQTEDGKIVCASCRYALEDGFKANGDYTNPLSLDALFVQHPAATYFVTVGTHSDITVSENEHLGISKGDILTIDRALSPNVGRLVLAVHGGTFVLGRLVEHKGERFLVQREKEYIPLREEEDVYVWGTVSALSRKI